MADLPKCSVESCESPVSKAGYTLCYKHWLAENKTKPVKKVEASEADKPKQIKLLSSTTLGEKLGINNRKVNQVLSELGWIERATKGWIPTEQGKKLHAESREMHQTGIPYVVWPEAIVSSRVLTNTVKELLGSKVPELKGLGSTAKCDSFEIKEYLIWG